MQDRCHLCGLTGRDALEAEETIAGLVEPQIWRHSLCGHVVAYRDLQRLSAEDRRRIAAVPVPFAPWWAWQRY